MLETSRVLLAFQKALPDFSVFLVLNESVPSLGEWLHSTSLGGRVQPRIDGLMLGLEYEPFGEFVCELFETFRSLEKA